MTLSELKSFSEADEETKVRIIKYISAIPDPQTRQMFELHFLRGLSYRQVAKMLGGGMTRKCVFNRISRYSPK